MLLLDENNLPTNSVFYLASESFDYLIEAVAAFPSEILEMLESEASSDNINADFFAMAIDFLFLLGLVDVDKDGRLYVSGHTALAEQ